MLRTLVFAEKEVATRDGRWFMVRTMPYRTLENMIDGVVITFTDITTSRTLEARLRESLALYQAPFERIAEGIMFQASGGRDHVRERRGRAYPGSPPRPDAGALIHRSPLAGRP